jgi:hypothetical protein
MDRRGASLVGDDVTAVTIGPEHVIVMPAPAPLKLWPDAAEALGESGTEILVDYPKREIRRPHGGQLPLVAIYVLEDADAASEMSFAVLSGGLAAANVAQNMYRAEWSGPMGRGAQPLLAAAEIARRVPVTRLHRPRDLSRLDEVARAVVARHVPGGAAFGARS